MKTKNQNHKKQKMENTDIKNTNKERGQMMILMVILIAATTLAAIAFSSFTVVAELRRVTDARLSTAALFAADTGIECILFREFRPDLYVDLYGGCPPCPDLCTSFSDYGNLPDGSKFKFRLVLKEEVSGRITSVWEAVGSDSLGRTIRSIQLTLQQQI